MRKTILWTLVVFTTAMMGGVTYAKGIIHDAEQDILQEQFGEKWAAQDVEIQKKLDALYKKHGTFEKVAKITKLDRRTVKKHIQTSSTS